MELLIVFFGFDHLLRMGHGYLIPTKALRPGDMLLSSNYIHPHNDQNNVFSHLNVHILKHFGVQHIIKMKHCLLMMSLNYYAKLCYAD